MCIHIYIYIYIYIHIFKCVHDYILGLLPSTRQTRTVRSCDAENRWLSTANWRSIYINIYIYILTYMYRHMCSIYIYIYLSLYTYIYIYIYIHVYVYAHVAAASAALTSRQSDTRSEAEIQRNVAETQLQDNRKQSETNSLISTSNPNSTHNFHRVRISIKSCSICIYGWVLVMRKLNHEMTRVIIHIIHPS